MQVRYGEGPGARRGGVGGAGYTLLRRRAVLSRRLFLCEICFRVLAFGLTSHHRQSNAFTDKTKFIKLFTCSLDSDFTFPFFALFSDSPS